jgi:hypothetical protein
MKFDFEVIRQAGGIEAISVLSMDLSRSLFPEMGLDFRDPEQIRRVLRGRIEAHRAAIEVDSVPEQRIMLGEVKQALSAARGAAFVEAAQIWFRDVFYWFPRKPWSLYEDEVISVRAAMRRGEDPLGLGDIAEQFLKSFAAIRAADIEALVEKVKEEPLSEWDQLIYRIRRYRNDEQFVLRYSEAVEMRYPFANLVGAVTQNRFQIAWEQMLPILPEHSLNLLHERIRHVKGIEVPAPREMRRRVRWTNE